MLSQVREVGPVSFPTNTGERVYMLPFFKRRGLPVFLKRWQRTVDAMLDGIETEREIYLMVDQGFVKAGATHRRPGPHIDGNWLAGSGHHGTHYNGGHSGDGGTHSLATLTAEALILASDVAACIAYVGDIPGTPGIGGDCSHINLNNNPKLNLLPNIAYSGNVTLVHESIPVTQDCFRTLVRLNVPGVIN